MTTFAASEIRLRRMLRDPNGDIWTSLDLQTYFNDAQIEIAQKTNLLVRVETAYYPPRYDYSYTHDWKTGYLGGDRYQCFVVNQASRRVICFPWEANYYLSADNTEADGEAITHPWEIHYAGDVADPPGILLHAQFDKMRYCAYDREQIQPTTEKQLRDRDRYYRSTTGQVTHYWRPDDYSNLIYLYPLPSSTTIQATDIGEITVNTNDPMLWDDGTAMTWDDGTAMLWEGPVQIISSDEGWLDRVDVGLITDVVSTEDALFMVYSAQPTEIVDTTDESDLPDYMIKYIEYGTLERAYGADTDGFIPSLRDYWKLRKEIGLKALARFQRMTLTDRDYVLGGQRPATTSKRLRLPEGYPAI